MVSEKSIAFDRYDTIIRISIDRSKDGTPFRIPQVIDKDITVEIGDAFRWVNMTAVVKSMHNVIAISRPDSWGQNLPDGTVPETRTSTPVFTLEVIYTEDPEWEPRETLMVGRDFILDSAYPNDYYKPEKQTT
jgi:hypothetical protein